MRQTVARIYGFVLLVLCGLLFAVVLWAFTNTPPRVIDDLRWSDSVFHFGAFFALTTGVLVGLAVTRRRPVSLGGTVLVVAITTAAGVIVELAQSGSSMHQPGLYDVLVNSAGAICGAALVCSLQLLVLRRRD